MHGKKRLLITGASGFIGSHFLKHFESLEGLDVWGLVRGTSNLFRLQDGPHNLLRASLDDPLETTLKGVDCVIHTAGLASDWGTWEEFYRVNVEGTLNLLRTSIAGGVKRFIYLSSTVVYGMKGNRNTTEEQKPEPFRQHYCLSKYLAEKKVFEHSGKIELFVLRPSNVFGPLDTKFTHPLIEGIDRGLRAFPKGGKTITSPCYVKNLAKAVELCVEVEEGFGEAYNITDGNDMPWQKFLSLIADELGKNPPGISLPTAPLYIFSFILEKLYTLFGSSNPPLLTPYRMAQVSRNYSFSIEKAKTLLNYKPFFTTLEGVRESVRWYLEHKGSGSIS